MRLVNYTFHSNGHNTYGTLEWWDPETGERSITHDTSRPHPKGKGVTVTDLVWCGWGPQAGLVSCTGVMPHPSK